MRWRPFLVPGGGRIVLFLILAVTLPLYEIDVERLCDQQSVASPAGLRPLTVEPCGAGLPRSISLSEAGHLDHVDLSDLRIFPGALWLPLLYCGISALAGLAVTTPRGVGLVRALRPTRWHLWIFLGGLCTLPSLWAHWYAGRIGGTTQFGTFGMWVYGAAEMLLWLVLPFTLVWAFLLWPFLVWLQTRYALITANTWLLVHVRPESASALPLAVHTILAVLSWWVLAALVAATATHFARSRRLARAKNGKGTGTGAETGGSYPRPGPRRGPPG